MKKVWVAGHSGMVGSAITRRLLSENCKLITAEHKVLDLTRQQDFEEWFFENKPDVVFMAAARVGGIYPNSLYPAEFIYENLMIESNINHTAYKNDVEKLLFLGASCIYPKNYEQPIKEEEISNGPFEPTNEAYAIAKIAGIKLCHFYRKQYGCSFIVANPTNLYGTGDNYHPKNANVPAVLLQRFHEAKINNKESVTIWGSGKPLREFMFVDDCADACIFLMKKYNRETPVNIGSGHELSIDSFAGLVAKIVGFQGKICYDQAKPNQTKRYETKVN